MKGLEEYIEKHGKHFTMKLAYDVSNDYWSDEEIHKALQKKVYYNVSGCTPGDIVYVVNGMDIDNMKEVVRFLMRCVLYDVGTSDKLFDTWVCFNEDFDFTHYI